MSNTNIYIYIKTHTTHYYFYKMTQYGAVWHSLEVVLHCWIDTSGGGPKCTISTTNLRKTITYTILLWVYKRSLAVNWSLRVCIIWAGCGLSECVSSGHGVVSMSVYHLGMVWSLRVCIIWVWCGLYECISSGHGVVSMSEYHLGWVWSLRVCIISAWCGLYECVSSGHGVVSVNVYHLGMVWSL